jgi:hypothetical protein
VAVSESAQLVDEVYLDREMCARSLEEFVKAAWHQVEPGRPYIPNWHVSAICDHLQAVSNGEINRLLINVPPSCMKSLLTCVFWPVWEWTLRPEMKWIYASYAATLSRRDALKSRRIMEATGSSSDGATCSRARTTSGQQHATSTARAGFD